MRKVSEYNKKRIEKQNKKIPFDGIFFIRYTITKMFRGVSRTSQGNNKR